MSKIVLALAAGLALGLLMTGLVGWAADYVFPPSPLVDMNPEQIKTMGVPIMGVLVKLLGWAIGTFAGAMLAMRLAEADVWPATAIGALMGGFELVRLFLVPHQIPYVVLVFLVIGAAAFGAAWLSTHGQPAESS